MSLKVWLPLNGSLENKGISNLTIVESGVVVNTAGKIGSCYSFDGSNDYISLTGSVLYDIIKGGSQPFSIAMWIYHNDSTRAILFGDHELSGNINFNIELSTAHRIRFYWNGSPDKTFNSESSVGLQTWTHITVTYNGDTILIYKNGTLITDKRSGTLSERIKTSGAYYLGRDNRTGTTAFNGKMNDFRLYDHCLSAAEVKEIAQGLVCHYKLEGANENRMRLTPNSHDATAYQAYAINMTENLVAGETYTMQLWNVDLYHSAKTAANTTASVWWGGGSVNLFAWDASTYFTKTSDTNYHANHLVKTFTVTETQASGNGATNSYLRIYNSPGNATGTRNLEVGRWKLEKGSTATPWIAADEDSSENRKTIIDSSGYNNNGTANVSPIYSNIINDGRYSNSMIFNGSTYIKCTQAGMLKDEITVSCWAYEADWSIGYGRTISCLQSGGWGFDNSTAKRRFYIGTGESSNTYKGATSTSNWTALSAGWHHFVGTYDGFNVKFYVDGELEATTAAYETKTPIYYNTATNIFIGAEAGNNQTTPTTPYFSGNISDVRIYATSLLDTEVKQLYNTSMKIDNGNNIHTFEVIEDSNNKITKQGQLMCKEIDEQNFSTNIKNFSNGTWYINNLIER